LRDGAFEFLDMLVENNVPLLIFSAGVGTLIQKYLESENKLTDNIHIIANFFEFNTQGEVTGYKTPVIHTCNKNEVQISYAPYLSQIEKRRNVLLLGDMLGDIDMAKGISHDCCINIGFLNQYIDKFIDQYSAVYDALVLNDGSMDYVNTLLKNI
jgi:5'-nucleotidase